jgi:CheY-like chemotaxis protein
MRAAICNILFLPWLRRRAKMRQVAGAVQAVRQFEANSPAKWSDCRRGAFALCMDAAEKTILVVDDDADVRELAVALLEAVGYRILQAASADAAYRLLLDHPQLHIDLLFTDIVMPGSLDGIDLAEKAQAMRPQLKILFATGFANRVRDRREDYPHGSLLKKPYRAGELRRRVARLLGSGAL